MERFRIRTGWDEYCAAVDGPVGCDEWLPGYSVNMAIGQGRFHRRPPIEMAVDYASLLNGGRIMQPHVGDYFGEPPRIVPLSTNRFHPLRRSLR